MTENVENLDGKEIAVIGVLGQENQNQRDIARQTGFSLGLTNLLLKNLVKKGYVKVIQLNGRTLRYILTPQGMQEKVKKSYNFVLNSVRQVYALRERIQQILEGRTGEDTAVYLWGRNEIALLVREVLLQQGFEASLIESLEEVDDQDARRKIILPCAISLEIPETVPGTWKFFRLYDI